MVSRVVGATVAMTSCVSLPPLSASAVVQFYSEGITHAIGYQGFVVHTHHDDTAILLLSFGCDAQLGGRCEGLCRQLLKQKIGHGPEIGCGVR